MARMTQYIGLNYAGSELVKDLTPMESDLSTYGMFDEEIKLSRWSDREKIYREVVQVEPWSSGPMIFCCLEITEPDGTKTRCAEWVLDPNLREHREYDARSGTYYV